MDTKSSETSSQSTHGQDQTQPPIKLWGGLGALVLLVGAVAIIGPRLLRNSPVSAATPVPPAVTVSMPLQKDIHGRSQLLGQFSAVDRVELRAQVGGTLTYIGFKDGALVRKGALLFIILP